jgi:hypothetical protein
MEGVLAEAELQQDWIESLATGSSSQELTLAFDSFLNQNGLREQLLDPNRRSSVIKVVSREIRRRANL